MIFIAGDEFSAVLDACVLVPAALCDTLLRLAEEPAVYRPLWSEETMAELGRTLRVKLQRTPAEVAYRRQKMNEAFPEALVHFPAELLQAVDCIPDPNDRHVLAAAIMAKADTIVTQNTKHFPKECLERYKVLGQTADQFLVDRYRRYHQVILDRIEDQAIAIGETREYVVAALRPAASEFCKLLDKHI
jgi:predicted nucleic acid-binding protein